MILNKLDSEEQEILNKYNKNELKSVKNKDEEIIKAKKYAEATLNKSKHISIRVSEKDLMKLKTKSQEAGVAYQTLIGILIHQYSENKIKIKI